MSDESEVARLTGVLAEQALALDELRQRLESLEARRPATVTARSPLKARSRRDLLKMAGVAAVGAASAASLGGLQAQAVSAPGDPFFDVKAFGAKGDGVADDTTAIQAAVTAAGNAGGGKVILPVGTYKTTLTLVLNKSNVELAGVGPGTTITFQPSAPFVGSVNDRPIQIVGGDGNFKQLAGTIAAGVTSVVAANASDANLLHVDDWIAIHEYDVGSGDAVLSEWAQVSFVAGTTINLKRPLRTAFANLRPYVGPGGGGGVWSGLGFFWASGGGTVENCKIRDLTVIVPPGVGPGPSAQLARGVLYENLVVTCQSLGTTVGQSFYAYRCNDVTVRNCRSLFGASEFGACTDLVIEGCDFGYVASYPSNDRAPVSSALLVDIGSGFFTVIANRFAESANIGIQLRTARDGIFAGNSIGWVRNNGIAPFGISGLGCQRIQVYGNNLAGADASGTGISFGDTTGYTVNVQTSDNVLGPNIINNYATKYALPIPGRTDVIAGKDVEGARSGWEIVADGIPFSHLAFYDVNNTNGIRRIEIGPGVGGTGQFGIYDRTGSAMLAAFLYAGGHFKTRGGVSPGTDAGAMQFGRLFMGTGAPNNANGTDGDFYLRTDTPGTANQRLYVRSTGAWIGIL